jgi:hypothetical protein
VSLERGVNRRRRIRFQYEVEVGGAARPKAPATAPLLEVDRPLEIMLERGFNHE